MGNRLTALLVAPALLAGCATDPDRHTLAELSRMEPDVADVAVDDGLEQAIRGYRDFLEETPESELTPDAMRRLADLKVEKVYGILGDGELSKSLTVRGRCLSRDLIRVRDRERGRERRWGKVRVHVRTHITLAHSMRGFASMIHR